MVTFKFKIERGGKKRQIESVKNVPKHNHSKKKNLPKQMTFFIKKIILFIKAEGFFFFF